MRVRLMAAVHSDQTIIDEQPTEPGAESVIDGHVDIGAGAKIIGSLHIGAHARIGANAVVIDDVPSNATAVGIPARVL